jgi:hypothetical protein
MTSENRLENKTLDSLTARASKALAIVKTAHSVPVHHSHCVHAASLTLFARIEIDFPVCYVILVVQHELSSLCLGILPSIPLPNDL